MAYEFTRLNSLAGVIPNKFVRTTDKKHKAIALSIWKELVDKGDIYLGKYEGWYSVRDECYYTEQELRRSIEGDNNSPFVAIESGAEVEWKASEESYFFRMSKYEGEE